MRDKSPTAQAKGNEAHDGPLQKRLIGIIPKLRHCDAAESFNRDDSFACFTLNNM